uniref:Uncharacterized protein n=1 Tax=Caenorhabditis japonica TaxID=281687 RepID=A0A8R1EXQ8_CAEJA
MSDHYTREPRSHLSRSHCFVEKRELLIIAPPSSIFSKEECAFRTWSEHSGFRILRSETSQLHSRSSSYNAVDALKVALQKAWAEIDNDYLRRTSDSVIRRLKACVQAGGSNFEYFL